MAAEKTSKLVANPAFGCPAADLFRDFDLSRGEIPGARRVETRLSAMRGAFVNEQAYADALGHGDRVMYHVCSVQSGNAPGDLHYGLGVLQPGRIGPEYAMTKGHYHSRREAAEVYVILRGEGAMLLEDESTGTTQMISLGENRIVYVPGHTAHRTYNTSAEPLLYLGIYPADAGHDYGTIAERGFRKTVVATPAGPECVDCADFDMDQLRFSG